MYWGLSTSCLYQNFFNDNAWFEGFTSPFSGSYSRCLRCFILAMVKTGFWVQLKQTPFFKCFAFSHTSGALKLHLCTRLNSRLLWQLQGESYLKNFGIFKIYDDFLKVLVKDIWESGFRSSLSQKLNICQPFWNLLNIASGSEANMTTPCEMELFNFLWIMQDHYLPLAPI